MKKKRQKGADLGELVRQPGDIAGGRSVGTRAVKLAALEFRDIGDPVTRMQTRELELQ